MHALQVYRLGSPDNLNTPNSSAFCLAGGGDDDAWGEGWRYLLQHASGGDVVVLRSDGEEGGYQNWIFSDEGHHGFGSLNSVTTLVIENLRDSYNLEVLRIVSEAEVVFFAGGDQSLYYDWMQGSPLITQIQDRIRRGTLAVGGTSAGMAILSGIDYAAHKDSPAQPGENVTAQDVLNNPSGDFVDLDTRVLVAPFLENVVAETHFTERDRLGRLVGFMARAAMDSLLGTTPHTIRGIGVDAETSLCYENDAQAKIFGGGKVFFLKGKSDLSQYQSGFPLIWTGAPGAVETYILSGRAIVPRFNLSSWQGSGGKKEEWWVAEDSQTSLAKLYRQ